MTSRSHTPAPARLSVLPIHSTSLAIQRQCDACQDEDARQLARKAEPAGPSYAFGQVSPVPPAPSHPPSGTLEVSEPHDAGEREADALADEVMRRLSPNPPPDEAPQALPSGGGLRVQRQIDPTAAPSPSPSAGSLLVDDDTRDLLPGQMRKREFLAALRPPVCDAADRELAAVGRNTEGCPYLDQMFSYYASRDARHVERAIRRYAPAASSARAAADYIPLITARIAEGVRRWAATGAMPELPEGLTPAMLAGGGVLGAIGGAVSSALGAVGGAIGSGLSAIGSLFFQAEAGAARAGVDAQAVATRLGHGRALDGPARARMEGAFGHSFEHVRIHDDPGAAHLSRDLGARAFTVGSHVAFAADQYRPGTVTGDALLAHELAHVVQQSGHRPGGPLGAHAGEAVTVLEDEADGAAMDAMRSLWGGEGRPARPRVRGGLRLQRCGGGAAQAQRVRTGPLTVSALAAMSPWQLAQLSSADFAAATGGASESPSIQDYERASRFVRAANSRHGIDFDVEREQRVLGTEPTTAQLNILNQNLGRVLAVSNVRSSVSGPGGRGVPGGATPSLAGKVRITRNVMEYSIKKFQLQWFVAGGTGRSPTYPDRFFPGLWDTLGVQHGTSWALTPQERRTAILIDLQAWSVAQPGFYYPPEDTFYLAPNADVTRADVQDTARHETGHLLGARERTRSAFLARYGQEPARWLERWNTFEEGMAESINMESTGATTTSSGYGDYVSVMRRIIGVLGRDTVFNAYFTGNIPDSIFQLIENPPP